MFFYLKYIKFALFQLTSEEMSILVLTSHRLPPLYMSCLALAPIWAPFLPPYVPRPCTTRALTLPPYMSRSCAHTYSALASTNVQPLPPHVPCPCPIRASPLPARHTCPDLFPHNVLHLYHTHASPLPSHVPFSHTCLDLAPHTCPALAPTCTHMSYTCPHIICTLPVSSLLFPQ